MIDYKWEKTSNFKDLSKHNFGDTGKLKNTLIELLDQFVDTYDKSIRVVKGCDEEYGTGNLHSNGDAVHIITKMNILEAFIKAIAFRGDIVHGPTFFTGVGCYIYTWKLEDDNYYSGLHLDQRPLWFKPAPNPRSNSPDWIKERTYPFWMNEQGIQIWGCIPNPNEAQFVKDFYTDWDKFPVINNKLYVPINNKFIYFVNTVCNLKTVS